ncbi:transposable element Tc1 transposase [Trichonephila clavipes]|nr:transposable element Tc1 transposase [Trichonephila clavipes]
MPPDQQQHQIKAREIHHCKGLHLRLSLSVALSTIQDEVEEPCVQLFTGAIDPDFIFMVDNARSHKSSFVDEFLERGYSPDIVWPVRSPDLNLVEDALGRAVATRNLPPRTIQHLKTKFLRFLD